MLRLLVPLMANPTVNSRTGGANQGGNAVRVSVCLAALAVILVVPEVYADWTYNGVPVSSAPSYQWEQVIAADGRGGAIIAWEDRRSGDWDIYVQRVDGSGEVVWTPDGVPLCTATGTQEDAVVVADGAGGCIVFWEDWRGGSYLSIYAQRVDASGVPRWAQNGLIVGVGGGPVAVSDGSGGSIVVFAVGSMSGDTSLYAQRIDADGQFQWAGGGVPVCTEPNARYDHAVVADGSGGVVAAWDDYRDPTNNVLYAQRVNSFGTAQWTLGGVRLCLSDILGIPPEVALAPDGTGGAIFTWHNSLDGMQFDVFAQRVDGTGTLMWGADGIAACAAPSSQVYPRILPDGSGGAIVSWRDSRGSDLHTYGQRMNATGTRLWGTNGKALCAEPGRQQSVADMVSDGNDGVIIVWPEVDGETAIYAQRFNGSGQAQWEPGGVRLCYGPVYDVRAVYDGAQGCIATWADDRDDWDVYAYRVPGEYGTSVGDVPPPAALAVRANHPNPFSGSTSLEVELQRSSPIRVQLYDVSGRLVSTRRFAGNEGIQTFAIEGVDVRGRPLASGVYFCRVTAAGETVTRKLVIAR